MLDFTIDIARKAGMLLLSKLETYRDVELKSPYELVTDADHASEALIIEAIRKEYPDHNIVAEESGGVPEKRGYTWVIDPLDGTNNYAHGFPTFCVSMGLMYEGEPFLGVVYDPNRDELFTAKRGEGARCNGRLMRVSQTPSLAGSLVSSGFPYNYYKLEDNNNLPEFDAMSKRVQGVRRQGAAALDLAYVAMGRLEAHWELQLKPWDTAAATLMVTEAGGRISDWRGGEWHPWIDRLVASNGLIHDEIIQVLDEVAAR
jgi:myo-inositol-1(or 4)-monophosphatase